MPGIGDLRRLPKGTHAVTLKDRNRGMIFLIMRGDTVVGAVGSEPKRFLGLPLAEATALAGPQPKPRKSRKRK